MMEHGRAAGGRRAGRRAHADPPFPMPLPRGETDDDQPGLGHLLPSSRRRRSSPIWQVFGPVPAVVAEAVDAAWQW